MGKTAIVISLVAANPMPFTAPVGTYKATVVMTSVSLMGQWEDECRKHAPRLKAYRYHPSSGGRMTLQEVAQADIIITSATKISNNILDPLTFHRVVMDESHLLGSASAIVNCACLKRGDRRWCISATPCTSSLTELGYQSTFLQLSANECRRLSFLKKHMIRHVKTQRINGCLALALPPTTTTVKVISMAQMEPTTVKVISMAQMEHYKYSALVREKYPIIHHFLQ
jgi:hypothetical protein